MSETPRVGAFAIIPSNDLPAAVPFWERLGFVRTGGDSNYIRGCPRSGMDLGWQNACKSL
jgi:hypothetical protein